MKRFGFILSEVEGCLACTMHFPTSLRPWFQIFDAPMPEFIEKDFKTILNKKKFIDSWFWDRYTLNPYNGCSFGCIYCDARSTKYRMPEDFENKIIVKNNIRALLDKRISNARTLLPDVVGLGGVTDCYQPAEKIYKNTCRCLQVLAKHRYPVHLATKSTLILRDADLFAEIGKSSWCCVSVSIPTVQPAMARFLDNRSQSPEKRFSLISELKNRAPSIQVGVLLIPLIPYLCDSEKNLEVYVKTAKDSGADFLLFGGGMTMRDQQALWFLKHLHSHDPSLVGKYEQLYAFKYDPTAYRGDYAPGPGYLLEKHQFLLNLCKENDLAYRIKRFIPADYRATNYRIAEMLLNEAYELQLLGENWSPLFWAGQNIQNLTVAIEDSAKRNELPKIRNVRGKILERIQTYLGSRAKGDQAPF